MRVMVVTHDHRRRQEVSEFLRRKGYEVQVPRSRHDVVPMMQKDQPEVVILDMYVANPSGLELLRQIRGVGYAGRIVALAGQSLRSVQRDALSWGVSQVVGGLEAAQGQLDPAQVETAVRACARMKSTTAQSGKSAG